MNDKTKKLIEQLSEINKDITPLLKAKKEIETALKIVILNGGKNITHGNCSATIRASYIRESWDGKGLKGYAVAYPEVNEFKKASTVKATVSFNFSK